MATKILCKPNRKATEHAVGGDCANHNHDVFASCGGSSHNICWWYTATKRSFLNETLRLLVWTCYTIVYNMKGIGWLERGGGGADAAVLWVILPHRNYNSIGCGSSLGSQHTATTIQATKQTAVCRRVVMDGGGGGGGAAAAAASATK